MSLFIMIEIILIIVGIIWALIKKEDPTGTIDSLSTSQLLNSAGVLVLGGVIVRDISMKRRLGDACTLPALFRGIPLTSFLAPIASGALLAMLVSLGNHPNQPTSIFYPYIKIEGREIAIINVCLIIPIFEEIFFRGYMFNFFLKKHQKMTSAAITSFIFTLLHSYLFIFNTLYSSIIGLCAICLLAMGCSYFYIRYRSLWPSIVLHGLYNLMTLALQ